MYNEKLKAMYDWLCTFFHRFSPFFTSVPLGAGRGASVGCCVVLFILFWCVFLKYFSPIRLFRPNPFAHLFLRLFLRHTPPLGAA